MSRTSRGSKPLGHDMWGKRPCAGEGNDSKKTCRKIERQQSKQLTREEIDMVGEEDATHDISLRTEICEMDELDAFYAKWEEVYGE